MLHSQIIKILGMKRSLIPQSLILLSFFLSSSLAPLAQQKKVDFSQIDKVALKELKETNTPGAAVAVVIGDRIAFAKGFGVSSIETGMPVTPDILFRIGSVTKLFTAFVLVTLSEEGKIKLDVPIGNYVKGLNPQLSQVTAHQLLSHTAGMTDESPSDYGSHEDAALSAYVRSLKQDHFFSEPGKIFSYSNPGFDVAGLVIEEIGGKPYADQMTERLFKPLGMNNSTFRPTVAMTYPLSQGHDALANGKRVVIRPFGDNVEGWPDGFMFSNLNDLARFTIAFMNSGTIDGKQVLLPSVITKLSTPSTDLYSRFGFGNGKYGYGLFIHDYRGVHILWHAGIIPGYGALLQMVPRQHFSVIILANKTGVLLNKTAEKAMELILALEPKPEVKNQPLAISKAELNEYIGTYRNKPMQVELFIREGKLYLKRENGEFPVTKIGAYRFSVTKSGAPDTQEFVMVPANDHTWYLHIGRHALKKIMESSD
jgi:CubicO group peptidase (beta-lactamase class C family)